MPIEVTRRCPKCRELLPSDAFPVVSGTIDPRTRRIHRERALLPGLPCSPIRASPRLTGRMIVLRTGSADKGGRRHVELPDELRDL